MREVRRKQIERPRARLLRGADGRLRASSADDNIGDIWAEQKRIRLAEAIERDRKKAEKQRRRSESKEVVVKIGLPKLKVPKLPRFNLPKPSIKMKFLAGGIAVVLVMGVAAYSLIGSRNEQNKTTPKTKTVLNAHDQRPNYKTILPAGKSIEDLGGWARVSPPDKAPVFAYVDITAGVQVNISQQPLPDSFKRNTDSEVSKLAEQFGAADKLVVDGTTVYMGTSAKGPQSVIFVKEGLLILAKSSTELANEQWIAYIASLR